MRELGPAPSPTCSRRSSASRIARSRSSRARFLACLDSLRCSSCCAGSVAAMAAQPEARQDRWVRRQAARGGGWRRRHAWRPAWPAPGPNVPRCCLHSPACCCTSCGASSSSQPVGSGGGCSGWAGCAAAATGARPPSSATSPAGAAPGSARRRFFFCCCAASPFAMALNWAAEAI